jgi:transposase InsO family protein
MPRAEYFASPRRLIPPQPRTLHQLREDDSSDHSIASSFTTTTLSSPRISMRRWRGSVSKRSERRCTARRRTRCCERLIGTLRRECLGWIIPLSEAHLRRTLALWMTHYNRGRPHAALGPGIPEPRSKLPSVCNAIDSTGPSQ